MFLFQMLKKKEKKSANNPVLPPITGVQQLDPFTGKQIDNSNKKLKPIAPVVIDSDTGKVIPDSEQELATERDRRILEGDYDSSQDQRFLRNLKNYK